MCRFKHRVLTVQENCKSEQSDCISGTYFIGSVTNMQSHSDDKWSVLACINNKKEMPLRMYMDTGAEANVPSLNYFKMLNLSKSVIKQTMSKLTNYGGSEISVVGQCILDCKIKNLTLQNRFFICDLEQPTILGLRSSENFGVIKKVCAVKENEFSKFGSYSSLMSQFSDLFTGLGSLPGESHHIKRTCPTPCRPTL